MKNEDEFKDMYNFDVDHNPAKCMYCSNITTNWRGICNSCLEPFGKSYCSSVGHHTPLKDHWHQIAIHVYNALQKRGYKHKRANTFYGLTQFIDDWKDQLIDGLAITPLTEKWINIIAGEIEFRSKRRYEPPNLRDLQDKGIITIIDCGELK